ncbi:SDR family oxidoreductase, partial [Schumannella luteola]
MHARAERPADLPAAAELVVGDVAVAEVWDGLLADVRPDLVIHLAAETGTAQSLSEATRHATANVVGTTAMTDAFTRHEILPGHIVLSSSRAVYGEGRWRAADGSLVDPGQRVHEQLAAGQWDFPGATPVPSEYGVTPPAPTSVYGATKLTQELLLRAWTGAFEVPLTILRLQNVYGDGQSLINPYTGIVSLFSQLARDGKSIPVYEDGAIVRDFVYIADVASAFEAASRAPQPGVRGFDVGSGVGTTILQLAETIAA